MKHICGYLDWLHPEAWLGFEQLPQALQGIGYGVFFRPLPAHALPAHGTTQPPDAAWSWPADYPFDAQRLMELALACSVNGRLNRYVTGTVLRHVWQGGQAALLPQRLQLLAEALQEQRGATQAHADERSAEALRINLQAAHAAGVMALPERRWPVWEVEDRLFAGEQGLSALRDHMLHCAAEG